MKYLSLNIQFFIAFSFFMTGGNLNADAQSLISDKLEGKCVKILRDVLETQSEWVKVHAAEYLLWAGYPQGVRQTFQNEEKQFGKEPRYRIGIWRVLAQAANNLDDKKVWTDKILQAFLDTNGIDRIHAAETLAKLSISPLQKAPVITARSITSSDKNLALYTRWSVSFYSADSLKAAQRYFFDLLMSGAGDLSERKLVAFVVRNLGGLTVSEWNKLSRKALTQAAGSEAGIYLLSTSFVTAPESCIKSNSFQQIKRKLLKYQNSPDKSDRIEMITALSEKGTKNDLPVLISLLDNENPLGNGADNADVKASAANAILKITKRKYY